MAEVQETALKDGPASNATSVARAAHRFSWTIPLAIAALAIGLAGIALYWTMSRESNARYITQKVTRGPSCALSRPAAR